MSGVHTAPIRMIQTAVRPSAPPARWAQDDIEALFALPLPELLYRAQTVHREHFDPAEVELATLLSIKTGGCPEDCAYCPQAARYDTGVEATKLATVEEVETAARAAVSTSATVASFVASTPVS